MGQHGTNPGHPGKSGTGGNPTFTADAVGNERELEKWRACGRAGGRLVELVDPAQDAVAELDDFWLAGGTRCQHVQSAVLQRLLYLLTLRRTHLASLRPATTQTTPRVRV